MTESPGSAGGGAPRAASGGGYGPLLDAVRPLRWPARRTVSSGPTGAHHSRARGSSAEFTEYRPYRQGDDPRRVDWKLMARSDRAYIRLSTDRAILTTMLIVDASASMAFPAGSLAKWAQVRRLAVALAAVAHADGDPVGLSLAAGEGGRQLAPRTRRGVIAELARTMDDSAPAGAPPLAPSLAALAHRGGGPVRACVVTDLLGDADALLGAARRHTAAGGEVHLVHLVAREELDPPRRALLAFDPESPELRRPLVDSARDAYVAAFAAWRDEMAAAWRAAGAFYTLVTDDEPAERAVRRIVSGGAPAVDAAALSGAAW